MCIADQQAILHSMAATYPEPLDLDRLYRLSEIDDSRARRALWGLVERGFVAVRGSPSWIGLPWSRPRLTEAGLAVACGRATLQEDAHDAVERLEALALSELQQQRRRQQDRLRRA